MNRYLLLAAAAVALVAVGGCSAGGVTATAPSSAPLPATTTTTTTTTTTSVAAPATTDAVVCQSLEKTGKAFYPTFAGIIKKERVSIKPITLSAQMAVLATTGAPEGQVDGAAVINQASDALRLKLSTMTRDATQTAQRFADAATGAVTGSDITPIVNSFTSALVACAKAGYSPSWFDPAALVG